MSTFCWRLIVFDLDGTLIDSARDLAESANELIVRLGGRSVAQGTLVGMIGNGAAALVARALAEAGVPPTPAALDMFLEIYDRRLLATTRPYDGIVETLERLHDRTRLAVLTNKPMTPTTKILDGLGMRKYFAAVRGGDSPDGRKPSPLGLMRVMTDLGESRDATMMVGDSTVDLKTARNAGVSLCLARYGFGFGDIRADQLSAQDLIIDEPAELAKLLEATGGL